MPHAPTQAYYAVDSCTSSRWIDKADQSGRPRCCQDLIAYLKVNIDGSLGLVYLLGGLKVMQ